LSQRLLIFDSMRVVPELHQGGQYSENGACTGPRALDPKDRPAVEYDPKALRPALHPGSRARYAADRGVMEAGCPKPGHRRRCAPQTTALQTRVKHIAYATVGAEGCSRRKAPRSLSAEMAGEDKAKSSAANYQRPSSRRDAGLRHVGHKVVAKRALTDIEKRRAHWSPAGGVVFTHCRTAGWSLCRREARGAMAIQMYGPAPPQNTGAPVTSRSGTKQYIACRPAGAPAQVK